MGSLSLASAIFLDTNVKDQARPQNSLAPNVDLHLHAQPHAMCMLRAEDAKPAKIAITKAYIGISCYRRLIDRPGISHVNV